MANSIRIREDLDLQKLYEWPNPKPPRPKPLPSAKFERFQQLLNNDRRAFKAVCVWNNLCR